MSILEYEELIRKSTIPKEKVENPYARENYDAIILGTKGTGKSILPLIITKQMCDDLDNGKISRDIVKFINLESSKNKESGLYVDVLYFLFVMEYLSLLHRESWYVSQIGNENYIRQVLKDEKNKGKILLLNEIDYPEWIIADGLWIIQKNAKRFLKEYVHI